MEIIKEISVSPILSDEETKSLVGHFIDVSHYHQVITSSADIYRIDNNEKKLLCSFRKKIIPSSLTHLAITSFKEAVKKYRNNNRGMAAGKVDISKIRGNIIGITSPRKSKTKVIYPDGSVSSYTVGNNVKSMIAGYFDRPIRKTGKKKESLRVPKPACRETSFTRDEVQKWSDALPLIRYANELYSQIYPTKHEEILNIVKNSPSFIIPETIFSTITINYNFRTALHIDQGDYHNGYSVLIVCSSQDKQKPREWSGCYLGYPQYGVCLDIEDGDFLLMDPHQYHGNTEFINEEKADRLSCVMYLREKIVKCKG